ncbi:MEDS domain-containing protein [Natroniella acetigena]|uniref:MEDS domain-containing protein n=1 Tax=Natroniella acetigena TaxID=52004 RepID=UPI00200A9B68|nr:MEDS domain-containing protein [Natroniella acetigena]MCK8828433.1 MEDS domain-containing protein [Natroniella acetigena]
MSLESGSTSRHVCSLYYGKEHFLVKTVQFLSQGLKEGEKVLYYAESELKEQILEALDEHYQQAAQLEFISELELIKVYLQRGKDGLQEELGTFFAGEFSKVRVLYQVSKVVKEVGQEAVWEFEEVMNEVLEDSNLLVLCMYDVIDLIEKDSLNFWLEQALNCHQSLLSAGEYLDLTKNGLVV